MTAGNWIALSGLVIAAASLLLSIRMRRQYRSLLDNVAERERSVRAWVSRIAQDDEASAPLQRCTLSLKHPLLGGACELNAVEIQTGSALRADLSHSGHCTSFTTGGVRHLNPPIRLGSEAVQVNLALHLLKREKTEARVVFKGLRLDAERTPIQCAIPLRPDEDRSGSAAPV